MTELTELEQLEKAVADAEAVAAAALTADYIADYALYVAQNRSTLYRSAALMADYSAYAHDALIKAKRELFLST